MIKLPKLFKLPKRFSEEHRPIISSTVIYSHALQLGLTEFVPKAKDSDRDEIFNGAEVLVLENMPNVIEVMFFGAKKSDLVSPEFLITGELTVAGKEIFSQIRRRRKSRAASVG